MDSFTRFLAKLRELIKGKVKDGDLTAAEFDAAVASARGHVGGTVRWENAKAEGNQMNEWKLFGEMALAEDGKTARIQIFPKVQKYSHPQYGELDVSADFLKTVKANFDAKIYGQELPLTIDLEHQTKLSGPAGWFKDLEIDGDKGMFATIEFNDRGKAVVDGGDGYKYFSPEFYDEWTDPATGQQYSNVLIGGALCARPFFKGMAPVALLSESGLLFVEAAESDEIPEDDRQAITELEDTLGALTTFEDGELVDLSPSILDGLIGALDLFQGEVTAAEGKSMASGGHGGHKGQHSTHGGSMGPVAKKAARKRVMGRLENDRKGMLTELRNIRSMKLNSPSGQAMRKEMIKGAQGALAATRKKIVAARAKYRTEPEQFAEADMDSMMAMMQHMMDMMGKMEMPDEMMAEMEGMMGRMKKTMPKEPMQNAEKTEDGNAYAKSDYLYAPTDEPGDWKLRVAEYADGKKQVTKAQLGRAAAALGKGFRGNKVELPDGMHAKMVGKLKGMYANMGVKPEDMPAMMASLIEAGLSEQEASACLVELGLAENHGGEPMGMTEEEARQFSEAQSTLKSLSEKLEAEAEARKMAEAEAKKAGERVEALERAATRKVLAEHVKANRLAYQGEVDEAVERLERLATKLGEEDFADYLAEREAQHNQMKDSALFSQIGNQHAKNGGIEAEFEAAKRKVLSENTGMSESEATVKVAEANPALYKRYDDAHKLRAKRGGE